MDWKIEILNRLIAFVFFVSFVIQPLGDSISRLLRNLPNKAQRGKEKGVDGSLIDLSRRGVQFFGMHFWKSSGWNRRLFFLWLGGAWVVGALVVGGSRLSQATFGLQGDLPLHYHLTRVMIRALEEGDPLVRWAGILDGGRGDAFFTFYPPLFYWLSALPCWLWGFSILGSLKLLTFLILVFNQATAYLLAREFFPRGESLWVGVIYLLLPGVAMIGLNRGFLPQALALGFLPIIVKGCHRILSGEEGARPALQLALGICATLLTHAISAYLSLVAVGLMAAASFPHFPPGEWRRLWRVTVVLLWSAGLTAFFWIPQVMEMGQVQLGLQVTRQDYRHYMFFAQAADGSVYRQAWAGFNDVASLVILAQTGLVLSLGIFCLSAMRKSHSGSRAIRPFLWFGLAGAVFGLLIALPATEILWRIIPGLPFIQFPWRFQPMVSLMAGMGLVAAWNLREAAGRWTGLLGGTLALCLFAAGLLLTQQLARSYDRPDAAANFHWLTGLDAGRPLPFAEAMRLQDQGTPEFLRYTANQVYFRPRGAETIFYPPVDQPGGLVVIEGRGEIDTQVLALEQRRFSLRNSTSVKARFETYADRHWRAQLDGHPIPIEVEPGSGLMILTLPPGDHLLSFDYAPPRYWSIISLISLLPGLAWLGKRKIAPP